MADENKGRGTGGGLGLCSSLFLIFLTLKLCGVISWSWWWVTAPLWIPLALVSLFVLACAVIGITVHLIEAAK